MEGGEKGRVRERQKAGIHGEKENTVYWCGKEGGLVLHYPHGDLGFLRRRLPAP